MIQKCEQHIGKADAANVPAAGTSPLRLEEKLENHEKQRLMKLTTLMKLRTLMRLMKLIETDEAIEKLMRLMS